MIKEDLKKLIADKSACIGVIGLGYVGLPLIVEFGLKGFNGIGFEVDTKKADEINAGRSYIVDVSDENVKKCVDAGVLTATTDFSKLAECDVIIICVPTPLRKTKDPDMSYILSAGGEIQKYMRKGQLVILESTTYPGTTDEVLQPMFEEKGFKLDEDFLLAFSPERVDPGNPQFQTHNIPKVVGGVSKDSTEVSSLLYSQIVDTVHSVSSARVAEACNSAMWLAFLYATYQGNFSAAFGWKERAESVLEGSEESAAQGWLALLNAPFSHDAAERESLAASALSIARRYGDADLEADALSLLGDAYVQSGRIADGMRLLDKAMAAITSGRMTDHFGRRKLFTATVGVYLLATIATGLSWDFT